jgi:hypothetical protein
VKRGITFIRRDSLDAYDPDHPYNFIKGMGLDPYEYGVAEPASGTREFTEFVQPWLILGGRT